MSGVALCRSAEDETVPCPFVGVCHETRQRLMHYATPPMRGMACWAFQRLSDQHVAAAAAPASEGTSR